MLRRLATYLTTIILTALVSVSVSAQSDPVIFSDPINFSTFNAPLSLSVGDLDGNQNYFLVVATQGSNDFSILTGNGFGGFSLPTSFQSNGVSPNSVVAADFNEDGNSDVVVAADPIVVTHFGDGIGNFPESRGNFNGLNPITELVLGDFDNDGFQDLAGVFTINFSAVSVMLGDGGGGFRRWGNFVNSPLSFPFPKAKSLATGDMDHDGHDDIIVANTNPSHISAMWANDEGAFFESTVVGLDLHASAITILDVDRDGNLDIVTANPDRNDVAVFFGNGNRGFSAPAFWVVGDSPSALWAADLSDDGILDLAVVNKGSNDVSVLVGDGVGNYSGPFNFEVGSAPIAVVAEDFNLDGLMDLAIANQSSADISILTNLREAEFQVYSITPDVGGDSGIVSVNISGRLIEDGVTVSLESGAGTISTQAPAVTKSGTIISTSFDLTGQVLGVYDVVVTNPNGSSDTIKEGFTIEEGRPAKLWMEVLGRDLVRAGNPMFYQIQYGNSGNVDWDGLAFITIQIPQELGAGRIEFDNQLVRSFDPATGKTNLGSQMFLPNAITLPIVSPGPAPHVINVRFNAGQPGVDVNMEMKLFEIPSTNLTMAESVYLLYQAKAFELGIPFPDLDELFKQAMLKALNDTIKELLKQFTIEIAVEVSLADYPELLREAVKSALDTIESTYSAASQAYRAVWTLMNEPDNWEFFESALQANFQSLGNIPDIPGLPPGSTPLPISESPQYSQRVRVVGSIDPNDKIGPAGYGEDRHISGAQPLTYILYFENLESATAPALEVVVSDRLDPELFLLNTLSFGRIEFGDRQLIPPPGLRQFSTLVDLRPQNDLLVRVNLNLNTVTGQLTARLTGVDPDTGEFPDDPLAGFLPPNVNSPEGEGSVAFTVYPRTTLLTGTLIPNRASIIFDLNAPIFTPEWSNTIDNDRPLSTLNLDSSANRTQIELSLAASDVGSGLFRTTIFASENDGPFSPWLVTAATDTVAVFQADPSINYSFYSEARDNAGNIQDRAGSQVISVHTESLTATEYSFSLSENYPNPFDRETTITYSLSDPRFVRIEVFNLIGQRVKTLVTSEQVAGSHKVTWSGENEMGIPMANGLYFYRIEMADFSKTRMMIMMRR